MAETIILSSDPRPIGVKFIFEVRGRAPRTASSASRKPRSDHLFGRFSKITGIREEVETVAWRDGGEPLRVRKGIGTISGGIATFEKGVLFEPLSLIRWFQVVADVSETIRQDASRGGTFVGGNDAYLSVAPILLFGMGDTSRNNVANETFSRGSQIHSADDLGLFSNLVILIGTCERDFASEAALTAVVGLASLPLVRVVRKITLFKCFPVAYQMADLDAGGSGVAIESLSVSFDGLDVDLP